MRKDELDDIDEQMILKDEQMNNDDTENIPGRFDTIRIRNTNQLDSVLDESQETAALNDVTQTIASLSLRIDLANDSPIEKDLTSPSNNTNNTRESATPQQLTVKPTLMKDLNKDERLRIIREKHEQELAKKKKELEDNLKRKEELWFKQQREKQRRIDEYKLKENEKRLACEERRKKREEIERVRLNEMVKREQERTKRNGAININNTIINGELDEPTINKSQSAYNLNTNNTININNRRKDSSIMINSVHCESTTSKTDGLSKRFANSTLRLATSSHSTINKHSGNYQFIIIIIIIIICLSDRYCFL